MTKTEEKTEKQTSEKNRLLGRLTYVPYGTKDYGKPIGPVFSTSRPECQSVVVESVPLDLIRDVKAGQIGSFFIWEHKEEKKESGA